MTLHIFYVQVDEDRWVAKCQTHPAWKCEAPTFEELRAKSEKSLRRHHSRMLRFEHYGVVGVAA